MSDLETFDAPEAPSYYPEYDGVPAAKLCQFLEGLDSQIVAVEDQLKALKARSEHLKVHRIPKALEAEGLKNVRLASGRGVTTENQMHVSVLAANRDEFHRWLKDSGNGDLVVETVHPQTLKSFIKRQIQDAAEFPADLVNVTIVPKAKFFGSSK